MRYGVLLFAIGPLCAGAGCTSLALKRQALAQGSSPTEIRYQEVLDNLAMVAANPAALPAYSSIFAGTAQITDTAQLASTTASGPKSMQVISPQFTRSVTANWTLDPVIAPEKLEAIRGACQWVLYGPEFALGYCPGLLLRPDEAPCPGRHFGVAERLSHLPTGWLHRGRRDDVPSRARHRANCGDLWVWVMPEDTQALADLDLIIQDIARVNINSQTILFMRPYPSDLLFPTLSRSGDNGLVCNEPGGGCITPGTERYRNPTTVLAEVSIDPCRRLMPDTLYYKYRIENSGSDANLRSQINASGPH